MLPIIRVKVRWVVVEVEHADHDPKESAYLWHLCLGGQDRGRMPVLRSCPTRTGVSTSPWTAQVREPRAFVVRCATRGACAGSIDRPEERPGRDPAPWKHWVDAPRRCRRTSIR